jgi:hypothetical protein
MSYETVISLKEDICEVKMTIKTYKKDEKDQNRTESKPEKLAKIMYEGIVRYTKARNALTREKNSGFELDSSGDRRVNMVGRNN